MEEQRDRKKNYLRLVLYLLVYFPYVLTSQHWARPKHGAKIKSQVLLPVSHLGGKAKTLGHFLFFLGH